jgi:hypothetical protein
MKLRQIKTEILVFLSVVLIRLPNLGFDIFNTDVWKWKQRIFDFGSGVFGFSFERTLQMYHPGVTLMWLGSIAVKFFNLYYDIFTGGPPPDNNVGVVFGLHFVQKLFVVIGIAFVTAFLFHALKRLFGAKYAVLAIVFMSLEPFYVALTRVIHLEGLMTTLMLASLAWLFLYLYERKQAQLLISAVFASLAVLTKTSALFLLPFSGIVLFLFDYEKNKDFIGAIKSSLCVYWKWLLVLIVTFIAVWPSMWVQPVETISTLYKGIFTTGVDTGHIQLFFGDWTLDPGPLFYFVVLFLRSSVYLLLGMLLLPFVIKKFDIKRKQIISYLVLFAILYFVGMTIPSKKLDRYLLPSMMALLLAVVFAFEWLVEKISKRFNVSQIVTSLLFVLPVLAYLCYLHPNYIAYYNPLGGGLSKGMHIIEPKWTFGQEELSEYFKQVIVEDGREGFGEDSLQSLYWKDALRKKLVVALPEKYYTQLYPFFRGIDGWAVIEAFTPDAQQSSHYVYPVWADYSEEHGRFRLEYRGSVYLQNVPIYNVYDRYDK